MNLKSWNEIFDFRDETAGCETSGGGDVQTRPDHVSFT